MTLGEAVKKVRKSLGKSQVEFAQLLGCRHNTVSRYELNQLTPSAFSLQGLIDLSTGTEREMFIVEFKRQKGAARLDETRLIRRPVEAQFQHWHQLLDKILKSGNSDAIIAVTNNLLVFGRYVDVDQKQRRRGDRSALEPSRGKSA